MALAVGLLSSEVSDLCLGKPALKSLSISSTIGDALSALKRSGESFISVWSSDQHLLDLSGAGEGYEECRCVGKVCMVNIICFLAEEENLSNPGTALQAPVSVLISKAAGLVRHLEPNASLSEAIDLILEGAQNLVIPLETNNRQYCWLTPEDIIRYLLNSIGLFCPTAANPINSLDVIDTRNKMAVHHDDPASSALSFISASLDTQTSVAVIDADGKLIGEISPFTLNYCEENTAAAIATLSAGDLLAYIDCGGPPEDLVQLVKRRLREKNSDQALEFLEDDSGISSGGSISTSYSSSSDDEYGVRSKVVRRSEAIVCYPWSSLVAVMIQALSCRVSYVWVIDDDGTLAGIVSFAGMMRVFR